MTHATFRMLSAAAIAAACAFAVSANAAPVPSSAAALGAATPSSVTNVQARWHGGGGGHWHGGGGHWHGGGWGWHGGGWGWGWPAAGFAAGVIAGGALAAPYYYGPGPYYAPGYYEPPAAYAPGPGPRRCWVDTDSSRGYGYWRPC